MFDYTNKKETIKIRILFLIIILGIATPAYYNQSDINLFLFYAGIKLISLIAVRILYHKYKIAVIKNS